MASGHRPLPSQSLCGRVTLSDGDHSVCTPVSTSGGLDGLHRSQGSVSSGAGSSCFSSLSSLHVPWHGLPVQSSVLWPLHGSAGLHQGHGSCFSYTPFSGYPYASIPRRLAGPVFLSGVSPRGSADCPPTLSRIRDCHQPPEVQPHTFPGSSVSGGRHRLHLFQGFSVGGTHLAAALNSRRVSVLRLAYRELVAVASRHFFLRWLTSFLAADCGCGPSSSASIVLGTVRIWWLQCWCRWSVFSISSGGSISLVYLSECLSARCLQTYTFGPPPRTWERVPISVVRSLPACGPPTRQRCLSTPGNCSLFSWGFSSSGQLSKVARWPSFATTPQQWLTFARRVAPGLLSSTPWLR